MTSFAVDLGLAAGFMVLLVVTYALDKAGNVLYRKRIAKPFYVLGHRLHHRRVVLTGIPACYLAMVAMLELHYLRLVWASLWPGVEVVLALSGICLAFDLALDGLSSREKRSALLHHEWAYLVVPAYIFTHLLLFV